MSHLNKTLGKTVSFLERLGLTDGLGMLWGLLDELEKVARKVPVCLRCLSNMLPLPHKS